MQTNAIAEHISSWLNEYCSKAGLSGFIVGISGGIDSALTSTLCAMTGKKVVLLSMPIRQTTSEYTRARNHMADLKKRFSNVETLEIDLTPSFTQIEKDLPTTISSHALSMANARARLRMLTLYSVGQVDGLLVAGTGNKIEDFGIGFFTKYGDGGVDVSPIADLTKSEVFQIAKEVGVIQEIIDAKPTDGLWEDGRSDEDQIGASYPELEWAMNFRGDENGLTDREKTVLEIYRRYKRGNRHKMEPIPVCLIPAELK